MATGRSNQLTGHIGEHLVAAELGRRGLFATPFAGNVPDYDLLVVDERGRAVPVQVKTISKGDWQFKKNQFINIEIKRNVQYKKGKVRLRDPSLLCVFVRLRGGDRNEDEFYIFHVCELQNLIYRQCAARKRRPRNPLSMHCRVKPSDIKPHADRWQVLYAALRQRNRNTV